MKQRPGNPSEGRSRRPRSQQELADDAVLEQRKQNPWSHDLELVNALQGSGHEAAAGMDPRKLLDALEGNYAEEKVTLKLPGIVKDPVSESLKKHPLQAES